jgi:hypothetical protein
MANITNVPATADVASMPHADILESIGIAKGLRPPPGRPASRGDQSSSTNGFFVPRNCSRIGVPGSLNVSRRVFTR